MRYPPIRTGCPPPPIRTGWGTPPGRTGWGTPTGQNGVTTHPPTPPPREMDQQNEHLLGGGRYASEDLV